MTRLSRVLVLAQLTAGGLLGPVALGKSARADR